MPMFCPSCLVQPDLCLGNTYVGSLILRVVTCANFESYGLHKNMHVVDNMFIYCRTQISPMFLSSKEPAIKYYKYLNVTSEQTQTKSYSDQMPDTI
jgi:hypothetical protein